MLAACGCDAAAAAASGGVSAEVVGQMSTRVFVRRRQRRECWSVRRGDCVVVGECVVRTSTL